MNFFSSASSGAIFFTRARFNNLFADEHKVKFSIGKTLAEMAVFSYLKNKCGMSHGQVLSLVAKKIVYVEPAGMMETSDKKQNQKIWNAWPAPGGCPKFFCAPRFDDFKIGGSGTTPFLTVAVNTLTSQLRTKLLASQLYDFFICTTPSIPDHNHHYKIHPS